MADWFPIVVYHNPACGTSRNVVAMIEATGSTPKLIEYLKAGWTVSHLEGLLAAMGVRPRDVLRDKGTPATELGLLDPAVDDAALLAAMVAYPILVNRPIVATPKGVRLCRPSERVLGLVDQMPASFTKEDGEVVAAVRDGSGGWLPE